MNKTEELTKRIANFEKKLQGFVDLDNKIADALALLEEIADGNHVQWNKFQELRAEAQKLEEEVGHANDDGAQLNSNFVADLEEKHHIFYTDTWAIFECLKPILGKL